jgi:hypothetical protein
MDDVYEKALLGTLQSKTGESLGTITIENYLPVPITITFIGYTGVPESEHSHQIPGATTSGPGKAQFAKVEVGNFFLLQLAYTGGFAGVIEARTGQTTYDILDATLLAPNDVGPLPKPVGTVMIPPDSPRVLVGTGVLPSNQQLTREQFWRLTSESYCLAPGETKVVSQTTTSGREETSSKLETIAASLSLGASASWGVVSASLSASLSTDSTTFQQVTISEQMTTFASDELTNTSLTVPAMYLKWQLTEVFTIFAAQEPLASLDLGLDPVLIAGPYDPNETLRAPREIGRQAKLESTPAEVRLNAPRPVG